MAKSAVYSWRVDPELKAALEEAAREERTSVADLLGRLATQWLRDRAGNASGSDAVQQQIRASAEPFIGSLAGGDPRRSELVRHRIRQRLARRRAS